MQAGHLGFVEALFQLDVNLPYRFWCWVRFLPITTFKGRYEGSSLYTFENRYQFGEQYRLYGLSPALLVHSLTLMGLLAVQGLFHQVLYEQLQRQTRSFAPFQMGQNQIVLKMVSSPCAREKRFLTASIQLEREFPSCSQLPAHTAAAAAVCHQLSQSSIIYFQIVCKALHHSLQSIYGEKKRQSF